MKATSVKQILKAIGNEHLDLVRGPGYWYFVYDDGRRYFDRSVMTMYLSSAPLKYWVDEGRDFVRELESDDDVPRPTVLGRSGHARILLSRRVH